MNRSYMTLDEALAVDRLSPGHETFGVGTRLRAALTAFPFARGGHTWYVDGTNGSDTLNDGQSWDTAFKSIGAAIAAASAFDAIVVLPQAIPAGATDPVSYAENVVIPAGKPGLAVVGYGSRTQGGLPQVKKGSGSTAQLTVRSPGCLIAGLGINGGGATGGGILLDDDGTTKTAFGAAIVGCHFKNCAGPSATDGRQGGAIQAAFSISGSPWQVRIAGNRFYKNLADIVNLNFGAGVTPQDWVIEDNDFSDPPANVDVHIWLGGNGITGLVIRGNRFPELPNIGGASVGRYMDLTGCTGLLADNAFGCTGLTFRNASMGTGARVPATMFLARNYQQVAAGAGATGEIGFTA